MIIATARKTTTAPAETIFALWADVEHWKGWDDSVRWSLLDGVFMTGSLIKMKPRGGPKATAVLTLVEPNHAFDDISRLPGATIYFSHVVTTVDGKTLVTHTINMDGPLAWLWVRIMGKGLRESLQPAVDKLVALAEGQR